MTELTSIFVFCFISMEISITPAITFPPFTFPPSLFPPSIFPPSIFPPFSTNPPWLTNPPRPTNPTIPLPDCGKQIILPLSYYLLYPRYAIHNRDHLNIT